MTSASAGLEPIRLAGPLLVFGGPYSNLEATRAVLALAGRRGIDKENILCTGDVVAYCADPVATVDMIREVGIRVVMGNCEESLGAGAADCGCGFDEGSACAALSVEWYAYADRLLDGEARRWMAALPRRIDVELGGRRLAAVHGGTAEVNKFIFASASEDELAGEIDRTSCDGVIAGHCGLPFSRIVRGRLWHNSGAIGMPANDGTPRVWCSVLTPGERGIGIEHLSLHYDHRSAAAKMRDVRLPAGYADALETGLWPSCDVLPPLEASRRGRQLPSLEILWST
jgi:predicted phosphodiesterase